MEKEIKQMKLDRDMLLQFLPMSNDAIDTYTFDPKKDELKEVEINGEKDFETIKVSIIPEEYRPTFELIQLDVKGKKELMNIMGRIGRDARLTITNPENSQSIKNSLDENDKLLDLVRKYVKGWSNFNTADGGVFEYVEDSQGLLSFECFSNIPASIQVALVERLQLISGLTPTEQLGVKS